MTLKEALGLERGEMLALIGAGGKTTTLYSLAQELWEDGEKVLVTTTTKIFKPAKPHVQKLYLADDLDSLVRELSRLDRPAIVAAGGGLDGAGKLLALPFDWFPALRRTADAVLIEADGAAMKPFKAPAEHEPVIPQESDLTVWVMGIKVLDKPLTPAHVHRAERAAALLGVELGTAVTQELILRLVEHPHGALKGIPPKCRKAALINQADSPEEARAAGALGHALIQRGIERAVVTSYRTRDPVKEVIT